MIYVFNFETMDKGSHVIETSISAAGSTVHEVFEVAKEIYKNETSLPDWFSVWVDDDGTILTVL